MCEKESLTWKVVRDAIYSRMSVLSTDYRPGNRKERPTHLPLRESFSPSPETAPIRLVPTKDYPGTLILVVHELAGILSGHAPDQAPLSYTTFVRQITGRERVDVLTEQGVPVNVYRELRPDLLLSLVTKIAFGFAVAGPGLASFHPSVQDVILRRDTNPFYWAGGTTQESIRFPPIRPISSAPRNRLHARDKSRATPTDLDLAIRLPWHTHLYGRSWKAD